MGSALNSAWGAPYPLYASGETVVGNSTMSTLNVKLGGVFRLGCSGTSDTITHVGYRQGSTTGTPAGSSYKIGLQSVDGSGFPDGTYLGGGSPASATFTPSGANDNTWVWVALANSISINRDARVGVVIERVAATDAGNCIDVAYGHTRLSLRAGIPYGASYNGSWSKIAGGGPPVLGFKSASAVYGYPAKHLYTVSSYGSTTEVGFSFTVPTNFHFTQKVKGVRLIGTNGTFGSGTHVATMYSGPVSGSVAVIAQSNVTDNDSMAVDEGTDRMMEFYFTGTLPTLDAGTKYGVGFATTTGSNMGVACIEVTSAADFDAWPYGQQLAFMTRTLTTYPPSGDDTNNFTETTTKRLLAELILDDITAPSGSTTTIYRGGGSF